jgi:hypothetical protein
MREQQRILPGCYPLLYKAALVLHTHAVCNLAPGRGCKLQDVKKEAAALACMQEEQGAMEVAMAQAGAAVERAQVWTADVSAAC